MAQSKWCNINRNSRKPHKGSDETMKYSFNDLKLEKLDTLSITYLIIDNNEIIGERNYNEFNRFNEYVNTPIDDIPFARAPQKNSSSSMVLDDHDKKLAQISSTYLQRMLDGVHPVYNTAIPDDSILNDDNVKKCFSFMIDILDRVMDLSDVAKKSASSVPKTYTYTSNYKEVIANLLTDEELRVTKFESILKVNIDQLIAENSRITTYKLSGWLLENGYLEQKVSADGRSYRQATELGMQNGIVNRLIENGELEPYTAYLFTRKGQQFVYDNLAQICMYKKERKL